MHPLDLYALFRVKDIRMIGKLNELMSGKRSTIKKHEIETLRGVYKALSAEVAVQQLDGYFFSYTIPKIGKEFDTLRISDSAVLNIELKYTNIGTKEISQQLLRNEYYLRHLNRRVYLFTYVLDENTFYTLSSEKKLIKCSVDLIVEAVKATDDFITENPDRLFDPEDFIFSPYMDSNRFLEGRYFLTQHQERIKKMLCEELSQNRGRAFFSSISGGSGTGKTLLAYDIALAEAPKGMVCLLTALANDHYSEIQQFDIITVDNFISSNDTEKYCLVIVDDAHLLSKTQLDCLIDLIRKNRQACVLATETPRLMLHVQSTAAIYKCIKRLVGISHYELTDRIRTDSLTTHFINRLLDRTFVFDDTYSKVNYENTFVLYANNMREADVLQEKYNLLGYECIDPTVRSKQIISNAKKRILLLNKCFSYNSKGKLCADNAHDGDRIMSELVFKFLKGIESSLGIIVVSNMTLFKQIVEIYN